MKNELRLLNILCFVGAILFLAFAILNAVFAGSFFTTDNLFITVVCLVMALMFVVNPLLQMNSEGRLPIPFKKRLGLKQSAELRSSSSPPLLDAKGRAVPPDVKSMVSRMQQTPPKES